MSASSLEVRARPAEPADREPLNHLYNQVTGRRRSESHAAWLWQDGWNGPNLSFAIEARESACVWRIIGHHGIVQLPGQSSGERFLVGKTENTFVDPDYRNRILYPRIEARLLADYRRRFGVIFTTSGPRDALRLRQAMGYQQGPPFTTELWVRGCRGWCALIRAWQRAKSHRHDVGCWDAAALACGNWSRELPPHLAGAEPGPAATGVRIERSREFLRWRYERHPSAAYSFAALDGSLVVGGAFRRHVLRVDEFLPGDLSDGRSHRDWRGVTEVARSAGFRALMLTYADSSPDHRAGLRGAGWSLARVREAPGLNGNPGIPVLWNGAGRSSGGQPRLILSGSASEGP